MTHGGVINSLPLHNKNKEGPLELLCLIDLFRPEERPPLPPPAKSRVKLGFQTGPSVWEEGGVKGTVTWGDQALLTLVL